jgi:hypothetical protein
MSKSKKDTKEKVKLQRNRYGCMIDLHQDWEISIVLDLDKQINHYTNGQRLEIYDIVIKTFENFLIRGGKDPKLDTKKK